jgi:hypothetical protein
MTVTRESLNARWTEIADKIVKLGEEFPADRYDYRPAPDVRTFADQLRHIAFWNGYVEQTLRGEKADGDANELPSEAYPTKAKILTALRKSFDGVGKVLSNGRAASAQSEADTLVSFIEHNGEHYGQLVVYYRLNGLVPPASRAS